MTRTAWSSRSQVEWVDLYTRQSLYVVHAMLVAVVAFALAPEGVARPTATTVVGLLGLVVNVAASLTMRELIGRDPATRGLSLRLTAGFVGLVVATAAVSLTLPAPVRPGATMFAVLALIVGLGAVTDRWAALGLTLGCTALAVLLTDDAQLIVCAPLAALFGIFTIRMSLWLLDVVTELDRARGAQAELAVAEERLRFSRDVHDVLGRRLSTISVQSELAATLAARGDDRAADTMMEVRSTAHEALREARELARGYRATSFEQELEGARSLLSSAGIDLQTSIDELPARWHEAAGWVVRETVTNVLRHSRATTVRIAYDDQVLVVTNDRPLPAGGPGGSSGTGLTGLDERLAALGTTLVVDRGDDSFSVAATMRA